MGPRYAVIVLSNPVMAKPRPWTVLDYETPHRVDDTLWWVDGQLPRIPIGRRMSVIRLADGRLVIHSAIALREEDMKAIEDWGIPSFLVFPNHFHCMDGPAYKQRYPDIKVLCPAPSRAKLEGLVEIDGDYSLLPDDEHLRTESIRGGKDRESIFVVEHSDGSKTLLFNDLLFNIESVSGFSGLIVKMLGSVGGPRVTRIAKWLIVDDKAAVADHLRELANVPNLVRIVPGHGLIIEHNPADTLRAVADRLHKQSS